MKTLSASVLGLAAAFACTSLGAACSSTSDGATDGNHDVDGAVVPDGATSTTCVKPEECPNVACSCANGIIDARHCVDGYCLDETTTCNDVCVGPDADGGGKSDGTAKDGASTDATTKDGAPPSGGGALCVPVSVSAITDRVGAIATLIASHQAVPPTPGSGSVNVSRNTAGMVTFLSYDAPGSADDYTDSLSYDSAGHVTFWSHNGSGTTDVTESFSYDSMGLVTFFSRNADGSVNDLTESFSYDSNGHLTFWSRNADGTTNDVTESYSYDSQGRLTFFSRNADGSVDDLTESFSYDSTGRLTYWSLNADGSVNDATVSVSYGSSGQTISSNGSRAAGATVKLCK